MKIQKQWKPTERSPRRNPKKQPDNQTTTSTTSQAPSDNLPFPGRVETPPKKKKDVVARTHDMDVEDMMAPPVAVPHPYRVKRQKQQHGSRFVTGKSKF